jgi:hypothetical protein
MKARIRTNGDASTLKRLHPTELRGKQARRSVIYRFLALILR